MKREVISAANFLVDLLRLNGTGGPLTEEQLKIFKENVCECLWIHYRDHWFPEKPERGSGYRCIRINGTMDPLIARAIAPMGIKTAAFRKMFPQELTMWVDPTEVAYRIGENGSICNIVTGAAVPENTSKLKEQLSSTKLAESPTKNPIINRYHQAAPSSPDTSILKLKQQQHHHFSPSKSPSPSSPTLLSVQQYNNRHSQLLQHPSPPSSPPSNNSSTFRDHQQLSYQQQQLAMFLMNSQANTGNCKDSLRPTLDSGRSMERLFVAS